MNSSKTLHRRRVPRALFTVEEANATLPLVRAIVSDLVELARDVIERRERLSLLFYGKERPPHDPYGDELSHIAKEVEKDTQRLRGYLEELRALGVDSSSGAEGLIDFPAMMDGRKVLLCWNLRDPQVLHWHEENAEHRQRQPLPHEILFPDELFPRDGGISQN